VKQDIFFKRPMGDKVFSQAFTRQWT